MSVSPATSPVRELVKVQLNTQLFPVVVFCNSKNTGEHSHSCIKAKETFGAENTVIVVS